MTTKTQHRAPTNARPATKAPAPKPHVVPAKVATPPARRAPTPTGRQARTRPGAVKAKPTAPARKAPPARRAPTTTRRPASPTPATTPTARVAPGAPMMGNTPAGTAATGLNAAQADALMQTMRETGGAVGPDTHDQRMAARHKIARRKSAR